MTNVTLKWAGSPPCGAASPPYAGEKYNLFLNQDIFTVTVPVSIVGVFVSEGAGGLGYDRTYTFEYDEADLPDDLGGVDKLTSCHFKDIGCMNSCCDELTARVIALEEDLAGHLVNNAAFDGTWVVTLSDAAGGGNVSPTTVTGDYTKIGDMVFASFIALNNIDTTGMTPGNTLYISLPFVSARRVTGNVVLDSFLFPAGVTMAASETTGTSWARLVLSGGNTLVSFATVAAIQTGVSDIHSLSLFYKAI